MGGGFEEGEGEGHGRTLEEGGIGGRREDAGKDAFEERALAVGKGTGEETS